MGSSRKRIVVAAAAVAASLALAPAASASAPGPIKAGLARPTSTKTLKTGVSLTRFKVTVVDAGTRRTIKITKISWKIGNSHVQLNSAALGSYYSDDDSVRLNQIRSWATGAGLGGSLVAAINGDFFADSRHHSFAGVPSGLLVHARSVYSFGWGGPAVGYERAGGMIMGTPKARPVMLYLPGGHTATVGAFNALSAGGVAIHGDQVAAYVNTGATVTVPSGYLGFAMPSTVLRGSLRGVRNGYKFPTGSNLSETVAAFRFETKRTAVVKVSMPTSQPAACPSGSCPAGTTLTVPADGVVLLARTNTVAATGLAAKVAAGGSVSVLTDDPGWGSVTDTMGGKPQLVKNGIPVFSRPSYVDPWQWDEPHWRPAVVESNSGHGWLIVAGGSGGVGIHATTWAKMLVQMGAKNAMGFDNNSSTELYRPGFTPITAYGFERYIPTATYLTFH